MIHQNSKKSHFSEKKCCFKPWTSFSWCSHEHHFTHGQFFWTVIWTFSKWNWTLGLNKNTINSLPDCLHRAGGQTRLPHRQSEPRQGGEDPAEEAGGHQRMVSSSQGESDWSWLIGLKFKFVASEFFLSRLGLWSNFHDRDAMVAYFISFWPHWCPSQVDNIPEMDTWTTYLNSVVEAQIIRSPLTNKLHRSEPMPVAPGVPKQSPIQALSWLKLTYESWCI